MRRLGIDISKWQSSWTPNDKASFCIMRSGYGRMKDHLFETFYASAVDSGVPRGAYHYLSTAVPWREQVDFFIAQVKGKSFSKFALDFETGYNHMSENFALCAVKWIDEVQLKTGVEVVLYTSPYTYRDNLKAHTNEVDRMKLWIAQYPSRSWSSVIQNIAQTLTGKPWMTPTGRTDWWMWQFTDKAPGASWGVGSGSVDLDILNGDEDFVSDTVPEPPVDTPTVDPFEIEVGEYRLTINIDVEKI